jgi:DNA-directed RNA polymerase specialized sigma24 family protein
MGVVPHRNPLVVEAPFRELVAILSRQANDASPVGAVELLRTEEAIAVVREVAAGEARRLRIRDHELAADAVQSALVSVYARLDRIDGTMPPLAQAVWIRRRIAGALVDLLRKEGDLLRDGRQEKQSGRPAPGTSRRGRVLPASRYQRMRVATSVELPVLAPDEVVLARLEAKRVLDAVRRAQLRHPSCPTCRRVAEDLRRREIGRTTAAAVQYHAHLVAVLADG